MCQAAGRALLDSVVATHSEVLEVDVKEGLEPRPLHLYHHFLPIQPRPVHLPCHEKERKWRGEQHSESHWLPGLTLTHAVLHFRKSLELTSLAAYASSRAPRSMQHYASTEQGRGPLQPHLLSCLNAGTSSSNGVR